MTSKSEKDRVKQIQDRCQNILMSMLKDEDNKYCVDCDAKGPRWASWNLGIFLCIRCAGIHRNLGVHISKVKSVNLDSWTPEQVVSLQQMGNSRARAVYEANLPDSFRRPQTDSALENFVRAKYEQRKYIAKEWVPPAMPKVNWDKEIDEELERQKRKKKSSSASGVGPLPAPSATDKKYSKSDVIPSLPKPKSSVSPKLGRSTPTVPAEAPRASNGAADLLGLHTGQPDTKAGDDIFSSFFSAPQEKPVEPKVEPKQDLKAEEQNFFNQAAPTEKEKSKLTKDSILALYSQTPAKNLNSFSQSNQFTPQTNQFTPQTNQFTPQTNQFTPQTNQFTPQTNQFTPQTNQFPPQTNQFNSFGSYQAPFSNVPAQNGMQSQQQSSQSQFNQYQGMNSQFQPQQPFGQSQPFQGFAQSSQGYNNGVPQPQPPQSSQLPQQFGGMNLGQPFSSAFTQQNSNVPGNVTWQ